MSIQETSFGEISPLSQISQRRILDFDKELIESVLALPKKPDEEIDFIDLDGTILDDRYRFQIDPGLIEHRGDDAYDYIIAKYSQSGDPIEAFRNFVKLLDPSNHLLHGYENFFDPKNSNHLILTAGNTIFQWMKIASSGLNISQDRVLIVEKWQKKPEEILKYLLKIGYIPGRIRFSDDRMYNFSGVDSKLAELLDTEIIFHQAFPDYESGSVSLQKVTENHVEQILRRA